MHCAAHEVSRVTQLHETTARYADVPDMLMDDGYFLLRHGQSSGDLHDLQGGQFDG